MGKVIIIGGGPAGCSTGITIKRLMPELEVELFEQRPKISKVECGEALSKKAVEENQDIIGRFFNKCIRRGVREFDVIINDNLEKIVSSPGYMIDRSIFNKSLLKETERVGCKVKMGHRAVPIGRKNGKWKVKVDNRYTHKSYIEECDMLVLAGGSSFKGVVDTGLISEKDYEKWSRNHVFGYQYKVLSSYNNERLFIDFRPNPTPEVVYRYGFYHHDNESNFGLLYRGRFVTKSFYDKLLNELLRKLKIKRVKFIERPVGNYIPGSGPLPRTYDDNVIAVGDNAGFANPIFFSGVHAALSSGRIGGKIIVEAFKNKDLTKNFLKEYESEWRKMPWGDPILIKGREIHEKVRNKEPVTQEELEIYSKALDITKDYGW